MSPSAMKVALLSYRTGALSSPAAPATGSAPDRGARRTRGRPPSRPPPARTPRPAGSSEGEHHAEVPLQRPPDRVAGQRPQQLPGLALARRGNLVHTERGTGRRPARRGRRRERGINSGSADGSRVALLPRRASKATLLALPAGAHDRRRPRHCASASRNGRTSIPSAASLRRANRRDPSTATTAKAHTTYCTVHAIRNASGV